MASGRCTRCYAKRLRLSGGRGSPPRWEVNLEVGAFLGIFCKMYTIYRIGIKIPSIIIPNTYEVFANISEQKLIDLLAFEYKKFWNNSRLKKAKNLGLTQSEICILASIVQMEQQVKFDEHTKIAGLYINRLKRNMKLQADPTVIYGITRGKYKLGRGLLLSELKKFSPWNTYKIDGLPPTPISNPGLASIKAATNPSKTDFLYFVSNGKGGHVFAKSYEKHLKNVTKWRKIEKQLKSTVEH